MELLIHPTAVVHPEAKLGPGTEVGPYAVIEQDVVVGARCRIESHAVIKRYTQMGESNQVFEGAVLGGVPQDLKYTGRPSGLCIGDRNIFREGVTVHRATEPGGETRIGSDNYLMANAHVAHDCVLEHHILMANNVALAGCIDVEDHAFISGGVVIHQFSRVGRYAMIGGNSKITQDVLPFFLTDGVPGKVKGLNLVGLKRGGFIRDEILELKKAYRVLFLEVGKLQEKLDALCSINSEHVRHLVSFIQRSKRGFCRVDGQGEA